ncbi:hypothetical protein [Haloprofundus salinisoli]|uniref:hypothetical protein n=1 Tax=Haloprofundus salinisoli TaxID=2876193 RepID=UPI001CCD3507|nr:hypothetical protein [Haloprofundus salinisoli]
MSANTSPPSVYDLLNRFGPYLTVAVVVLLLLVALGFREFLVVVWFLFASVSLYFVYRFLLAFERIADAAQRFAAVREREADERP